MSDGERWPQVSDILARALDLPESERDQFIADACRREPALRPELLAMFEELRTDDEFLEQPPAIAAASFDDGSGGAFGAYSVVRKLGEGGMGVVCLAQRSDGQFTRQVAIKRIGSVAPGPDLLRRFRAEREILARLDHPNIARLLDAGFDSLGVPYLVMEYVDGVPLMAWCRDRQLSVADRLALCLEICGAVQHAHQNLVIHRDIKPANILVTSDGRPVLLDFGIAKIFGGEGGGDATQTVNRALSLDYASPEQVRGETMTTGTDVYSLGVLLYELLADTRPYDAGSSSLTDAIRSICEDVPPPPSRKAPAGRGAQLRGDLDAIVSRAMEKTPAERYTSVAELAEDVRAHLDDRPVKAQRPSFAYLARKFARRHRGGTAVAAGIAILLAAGVSAVIWQSRIAERERGRAERRFQEVRELANFVIFDLQDGIARLPGATELRARMIERSLRYLDSLANEAGDDPRLLAELAGGYTRLADALGRHESANLGDRPGARAAYGKARALLERAGGDVDADANRLRQLARLLLTMSVFESNERQADQAARMLQSSIDIWNKLAREEPESEENLRGLASARFSLSTQHVRAGRRDAGAVAMQDALEIFERLLAKQPHDADRKRNVALCHKNLVGYFASTDPARSLQHATSAARLDSERVAADPHNAQAKLDYAIDLSVLGDHHLLTGLYDEALPHYEKSLELRRTLAAADPRNAYASERLGYILAQTGVTHVLANDPARGVPLLLESLRRLEATAESGDRQELGGIRFRAYVALGEAHFALKQDHCAWDRRVAAEAAGLDLRQAVPVQKWLTDRALARARTCK
jgi:serine/threonine protein kinase/tetratricopeptide (TPR) repeat protein